MNAEDLLNVCPVIPVVVLRDADHAVPLARALVAGGLPAVEVTLRTPAALEAIKRIAAEVPEAVVGAGTVVTAAQAAQAAGAGARFLVSPGCTDTLRRAMTDTGLPFLAGVSSASEAMALLEHGITAMKFFPAQAAGGPAYLKALAGPLPQVRFCPTGGITPQTAPDYLALPNVGCVGGSWLAPEEAMRAGAWDRIRQLARQAAALR
ncbi:MULTISPECIES: bifunctional 4-hydroxy-2-oxoglutarate aldolase/2-dehydro-3-deoxy-phosphogluconate aldolase [Thermomonospora]|uniref:2-dehydro-3-deoxy-phosphogluconate aldolase n=1 Tax=Thermomonospora curvata (strain ATCC 19995 / DSM 43183 / JCM 3096 / KCTC 9072 / NBRC 15933 / NCIMB 10081 / Henssen B9) TaxID=471852 RepID=D1AC52_THECD|nr:MULTISPECIES: bifunctional 4-hydroxy-2-oxoglutarate aldolase/2-dehydro-3-deoxy-phosphogluconate aldolase [Thermomonospora]ACY97318.1 2-dehydro-3-deoxyphosphogluconate aldolase/4- hydroxy-2-oxoglutarate aldolase [Thermomonospora curvata DSM 43183]PKK14684.1 MAG: keto-deoxy-phosphogluconate aldolase [Thermomonospora sp. CIF 1]